MATPVGDSIGLTGDPRIDGLTQGGSWQFSGAPVLTYSFSLNTDPGDPVWTSNPEVAQAFRDALTAWSNVANISFVEFGSGTSVLQSAADLAFVLERTPDSPILGLGFFPDPDFVNSAILPSIGFTRETFPHPEGDIQFNIGRPISVRPGSVGYAVILHEIGHALGLKHTTDDGGNGRPTFSSLGIGGMDSKHYTVMSGNDPGGQSTLENRASTPMLLDILAIQKLYGANMSFNAGNDTYLFGDGRTSTIWDAGGIDTLNATNAGGGGIGNVGNTVDLRQGHLSTIGQMTVGIAYGVTIENADGSSYGDTIIGNEVGNVLRGNGGNDTLIGGPGNDTYIIISASNISENAGEGIDLVESEISYSLAANVENLTLTGVYGVSGTGNALDNVITGNHSENALTGGAGNDVLDGGTGFDSLVGGTGNDTYVLNDTANRPAVFWDLTITGDPGDPVTLGNTFHWDSNNSEFGYSAFDSDGDGIPSGLQLNGSGGGHSFVVKFGFTGSGTDLDPGFYTGAQLFAPQQAGLGMSILVDSRSHTNLTGTLTVTSARAPDLFVTDLNVRLDEWSSPDGPASHATLVVTRVHDDANTPPQDSVTENAGEGIDTIVTPWAYVLSANLENLRLTGTKSVNGTGNASNNWLTGNAGVNTLISYAGNDTLSGGLGNDYLDGGTGTDYAEYRDAPSGVTVNLATGTATGGAGSDTLISIEGAFGSAFDDILVGDTTGNWIEGGAGNDTLYGGPGDDYLEGGVGYDQVDYRDAPSSVAVNLAAGTGSGGAGSDYLVAVESALGSAFDDMLVGDAAGNLIEGNAGNDTLGGGAADDSLVGGSGNDFLDGGIGNDTLVGGAGLDTALYPGARSAYTVAKAGSNITVSGPGGVDSLIGIERLRFSDSQQAFGESPAIGDLNGDGKSDLALRHDNGTLSLWIMDGGRIATATDYAFGNHWRVLDTRSDFNGDGKSDIALRHDNGTLSLWIMNGAKIATATDYAFGNNWRVLETRSDLNGDGKSDIVLRHDNGTLSLWIMDGAKIVTATDYAFGNSWRVLETRSDLNGDGKSDIVLRHDNGTLSLWIMDGARIVTATDYTFGNTWHVLDTRSDFNGDGKSDIALRHDNGTLSLWIMDGARIVTATDYAFGNNWHVIETRTDLNGDGKSDIALRHDNGTLSLWIMDGARIHTATDYAFGNHWNVLNTRDDLNGDGKSDIILRHDNGTVSLWIMDGAKIVTATDYSFGPAWQVVNTHDSMPLYGSPGNDTLVGLPESDLIAGGLGNDVLTGGYGEDTFVYKAGQSGAANADHITDFAPGEGGDALDIRELLTDYVAGSSQPGDFVQLVVSGGNTQVFVDGDGAGSAQNAMLVATLDDIAGLQLSELIANHNLILA